MAKRFVNETVVLARKNEETGKVERITPPIGKNFDFTAEEIESIEEVSDSAISKANPDAERASAADAEVVDGAPVPEGAHAAAGTGTGSTAKDTKAKTSGGSGTAAKGTPNKDEDDL